MTRSVVAQPNSSAACRMVNMAEGISLQSRVASLPPHQELTPRPQTSLGLATGHQQRHVAHVESQAAARSMVHQAHQPARRIRRARLTCEQRHILEGEYQRDADWGRTFMRQMATRLGFPYTKIYKWHWHRTKKELDLIDQASDL